MVVISSKSVSGATSVVGRRGFSFSLGCVESGRGVKETDVEGLKVRGTKNQIVMFLSTRVVIGPSFISLRCRKRGRGGGVIVYKDLMLGKLCAVCRPECGVRRGARVVGLLGGCPAFAPDALGRVGDNGAIGLLARGRIDGRSCRGCSFSGPFMGICGRALFGHFKGGLGKFRFP